MISDATPRPFLHGAGAGIFTAIMLQPLDVLRTQHQGIFQATSRSSPSSSSTRTIFREILQRRSITGFWTGTVASTWRVGLGAGTYFMLLQNWLPPSNNEGQRPSSSRTFVAGALARSLASALLCPLTVIKSRMEWNVWMKPNVRTTLNDILTTDGWRGLYRGLLATIGRDAPFSGFYVCFYSQLKTVLTEWWISSPELEKPGINTKNEQVKQGVITFTSGVLAGVSATLLTHPADTIKTRLQLPQYALAKSVSNSTNVVIHLNTVQAIKRLFREEGWRGFYRGILPRMTKRALATALTWTLYEHFAAQLKNSS